MRLRPREARRINMTFNPDNPNEHEEYKEKQKEDQDG